MRYEDKDVRRILDQSLAAYRDVSQEDVGSAVDRVWENLRPGQTVAEAPLNSSPVRPARRSLLIRVAVIAAAAIVLALFIPMTMFRDAPAALEVAARDVHFGEVVRSGIFGEVVVLADGSRVEMRKDSELLLERAPDGVRIQLNSGGIIVNAAKQRTGHLYVKTKDVTVSVVGTVFLVKAEAEGSRVAVIEGEVHVQQGSKETKLRPGEQVMSNPKMESLSVKEEVAWSSQAVSHVALLEQAASSAAAQIPKEERVAFEVVTIRPAAPRSTPGAGARGGGGGLRQQPCAANPPPGRVQLDPRRFSIRNASVYELVAWAIGPCHYVAGDYGQPFPGVKPPHISFGPDWIMSEGWDIEALIPEGSDPLPTNPTRGFLGELQEGRSPKLQKMILTMLEERFKVAVRREMREVPAYVLTVGPNGTKFQPKDWVGYLSVVPARRPEQALPVGGDDALVPVKPQGAPAGGAGNPGWDPADPVVRAKMAAVTQGAQGLINWESGMCLDTPGAAIWGNPGQYVRENKTSCTVFVVLNQSMSTVLHEMQDYVRKPILDRTGIPGRVSFAVDWIKPPNVPGQFYAAKSFQEFSKAMERVGLQVKEDPKGLVEYFMIERAERPSEN